jgi:hypothetical protein
MAKIADGTRFMNDEEERLVREAAARLPADLTVRVLWSTSPVPLEVRIEGPGVDIRQMFGPTSDNDTVARYLEEVRVRLPKPKP